MRVDLYNSAASEIAGESIAQSTAQTAASAQDADSGDRTTLTSDSTSVNSLVSEAMSMPAIRQDKVQSLQQAISSGQYQLDSDQIAGAMIDEHA